MKTTTNFAIDILICVAVILLSIHSVYLKEKSLIGDQTQGGLVDFALLHAFHEEKILGRRRSFYSFRVEKMCFLAESLNKTNI